MKHAVLISLLTLICSAAMAQDRIYRCGNEYMNNVRDAEARGCKLVEGGNVTVVQGTRPQANSNANNVRVASSGPKVDSAEQRARDADSRAILESELSKAKALQSDLLAQYKNGQPDKQGGEAHNYQKYLDRVAEMKASIARNESDIAGIQREIARLPASK